MPNPRDDHGNSLSLEFVEPRPHEADRGWERRSGSGLSVPNAAPDNARTAPDNARTAPGVACAAPPPGLTLVSRFVSLSEEARLLRHVNGAPWRTDLKRRVQHYGWVYRYRSRRTAASRIGPLPRWLLTEAERLAGAGWFAAPPDQVIVNEYEPGQGIGAHVDCVPCFGDTVATLSLGSPCVMALREKRGAGRFDLVLAPGSLLVLQGPARYGWTHAIPARKSDKVDGIRRARTRRVSLTFRAVRDGSLGEA